MLDPNHTGICGHPSHNRKPYNLYDLCITGTLKKVGGLMPKGVIIQPECSPWHFKVSLQVP